MEKRLRAATGVLIRVPDQNTTPLRTALTEMLDEYFDSFEGVHPTRVHEMVLSAVELPLLEYIMRRCHGNQCAAAEILGINRNTLRKRLKHYGLLQQGLFKGNPT